MITRITKNPLTPLKFIANLFVAGIKFCRRQYAHCRKRDKRAVALCDKGEHEKAISELLYLANNDCAESVRLLGACYYSGKGVTKDTEKAYKFFYDAAVRLNLNSARYDLVNSLLLSDNEEKNKEGIQWLEKFSAEGGNNDCMLLLAFILLQGKEGCEQDIPRAIRLCKAALNTTNSREGVKLYVLGIFNLIQAQLLEKNRKKTEAEGIDLLEAASGRGVKLATFVLGMLYLYGSKLNSITENREEACKRLKYLNIPRGRYFFAFLQSYQKDADPFIKDLLKVTKISFLQGNGIPDDIQDSWMDISFGSIINKPTGELKKALKLFHQAFEGQRDSKDGIIRTEKMAYLVSGIEESEKKTECLNQEEKVNEKAVTTKESRTVTVSHKRPGIKWNRERKGNFEDLLGGKRVQVPYSPEAILRFDTPEVKAAKSIRREVDCDSSLSTDDFQNNNEENETSSSAEARKNDLDEKQDPIKNLHEILIKINETKDLPISQSVDILIRKLDYATLNEQYISIEHKSEKIAILKEVNLLVTTKPFQLFQRLKLSKLFFPELYTLEIADARRDYLISRLEALEKQKSFSDEAAAWIIAIIVHACLEKDRSFKQYDDFLRQDEIRNKLIDEFKNNMTVEILGVSFNEEAMLNRKGIFNYLEKYVDKISQETLSRFLLSKQDTRSMFHRLGVSTESEKPAGRLCVESKAVAVASKLTEVINYKLQGVWNKQDQIKKLMSFYEAKNFERKHFSENMSKLYRAIHHGVFDDLLLEALNNSNVEQLQNYNDLMERYIRDDGSQKKIYEFVTTIPGFLTDQFRKEKNIKICRALGVLPRRLKDKPGPGVLLEFVQYVPDESSLLLR